MYRITREGVYTYNRETGERMSKPKWPEYREYAHDSEWYPAYYRYVSDMKKWDAFVKALPEPLSYQRPNLKHATEKGVPVSGLRSGGRRKYKNGAGVSANSRVLSHHYADEGEKGQEHRREIKRKERAMWLSEWQREQMEEASAYDAETVAQWFYDQSDDVDSDIIPSVYTVGETVVEWSSDYYDEYNYGYGCGDPYCDICGTPYEFGDYDREMLGYPEDDFCAHCGGPCEL